MRPGGRLVGTRFALSPVSTSNTGDTMSSEIEADVQAYSSPPKGTARRRVDAYHETLRERNALRELEQPFLNEVGSWHPRHF